MSRKGRGSLNFLFRNERTKNDLELLCGNRAFAILCDKNINLLLAGYELCLFVFKFPETLSRY